MAECSLTVRLITRKEARAAGLRKYNPGTLCKRGHQAERYLSGQCVVCLSEYQRRQAVEEPEKFRFIRERWRNANRNKVNAAAARRRAADPERIRAASRRYRERHIEARRQNTRDWRARNRDKVAAYQAQYDATKRDREVVRTRVKKWVQENPDKHLAQCHKRRARVLGAEGTYTPEDIAAILLRQNALCLGCQTDIRARHTIDHILPLIRGGSNWPANLQLLCKACNSSKNDRTMEEWLAYKRSL